MESRRPYSALYPTLGSINQLESAASSNYHSLQAQYTQRLWKGVTTKLGYTWGHLIDDATEPRNLLPANSYNMRLDRAASDFDVRHIFTGFASYSPPDFAPKKFKLTRSVGSSMVW